MRPVGGFIDVSTGASTPAEPDEAVQQAFNLHLTSCAELSRREHANGPRRNCSRRTEVLSAKVGRASLAGRACQTPWLSHKGMPRQMNNTLFGRHLYIKLYKYTHKYVHIHIYIHIYIYIHVCVCVLICMRYHYTIQTMSSVS